MKIKLLQQAMGQAIGAEMEVEVEIARLLIGRGAAEAIDGGPLASDPLEDKAERKYPERNKSMAARQTAKG